MRLFRKNIKALALASIFCFFATSAHATTANISSLVFTTPVRTASPDSLSDELTVQTQNASGSSEQVDETNDVTFTSSSASGQFLNSSGNAVSTTMSKNTASRTFYYKDTTTGTHTLTVSIKGRTTGITFTASQSITIGGAGSQNTEGSTTASSTSSSSGSSSSSDYLSAHSEEVSISSAPQALVFQSGAGRDRITTVGVPIRFKALLSSVPPHYAPVFTWSFGDGSVGYGEEVFHKYVFAGDYNVVLNVRAGEGSAVSRLNVKVVPPEVAINEVRIGRDGFVELENNSPYEVNLWGWRLSSSHGISFGFAPDTIVDPTSAVKFPFAMPEDAYGHISLIYPDGSEKSRYDISYTPSFVSGTGPDAVLTSPKVELKKQSATHPVERKKAHSPAITKENDLPAPKPEGNIDQTAALINAMKDDSSYSGVGASFWRFIKSIFGY